ncbi:MAG: hypothetical protein ACI92W_001298 [Paraglaciecola sp.]|jgi:hypothetical protein
MKLRLLGSMLIICLLSVPDAISQDIHGENDVWFLLLTHYKINEQLSLGNELHFRYNDYLNDKQQFLLRPFIDYKANDVVTYSFGYTYIRTNPYGEFPLPEIKPEHNIWEQINLKHTVGQTTVQHRYRAEQRWQGDLVLDPGTTEYQVDGYELSHRFRYRLTLTRPINDRWFVNVFDEIWVKTDNKLVAADYDRNWIYVGLGHKFSDLLSIQVAYLHQHAKNNPTRFERHPTLQLTADIQL